MIRSPSLGCVMLLRRCDGGFIWTKRDSAPANFFKKDFLLTVTIGEELKFRKNKKKGRKCRYPTQDIHSPVWNISDNKNKVKNKRKRRKRACVFQSIPLISTFITRRMDIWDDVRSYSMSNFFSPLSFLRHRALFFFSRFFFYLSFFCSYFYLQFMCAFFVRLSEKQREKETSRIHGSVSDGGEMSGLRHYLSRRLYSHLRERGWTYTHTHKKRSAEQKTDFLKVV